MSADKIEAILNEIPRIMEDCAVRSQDLGMDCVDDPYIYNRVIFPMLEKLEIQVPNSLEKKYDMYKKNMAT